MVITLTEVVTFLVALMAVGVLAIIAIRRKMKSYVVRITDDYSNPNAPPRTFYAVYNQNLDCFILMRSLLSIWPYKTMRYVNFSSYAYEIGGLMSKGKVDCIESYTGTPGDVDIIPVHHATPSRLGVENWLVKMRGSLVQVLLNGGEVIKMKKDGKPELDANDKPITENIKGLDLSEKDKDKIEKLINLSWFGTANGYLPVENIGVLREDIRQAAKRFYAKSYDKEHSNDTFIQKYGGFIGLGILLFIVGLAGAIYWQNFFQNLSTYCAHGYCPNYQAFQQAAAGGTSGSILPSANTFIANGGG